MKRIYILSLIFAIITLFYWGSLVKSITFNKKENAISLIDTYSFYEDIYYCGPKTRDYTDTPPGGGIVLVPIVLAIVFVWWIIGNIGAKVHESNELTHKSTQRNNELALLYRHSYTKVGPLKNGIQLVQVAPGKFGYVNAEGIPIIREIFNNAEEFEYESAIVERDGKYALLKKTGSYIIEGSSWIRAIGKCIIVSYSSGNYIYNRKGEKIYKSAIINASLDSNQNYVLNYFYLLDTKLEIIIDELGNIIYPLHNKEEEPQILYDNIALYHAGEYCGLIEYKSKKIILEATKNHIKNIRYFSHTKQLIIDSVHNEFSQKNKYDISYICYQRVWHMIYDEKLNLQGILKNVEICRPLTSSTFICTMYKTNSHNYATICDIDGTKYPQIAYPDIMAISDTHQHVLAIDRLYDYSNCKYIIHNVKNNNIVRFDAGGETSCRIIEYSKTDTTIKMLKYKKHGMYGIINLDLEEIIPFKYTKITTENDRQSGKTYGFICYLDEKNWEAFDDKGKPINKQTILESKEKARRERDIEDWLMSELNGGKNLIDCDLYSDVEVFSDYDF